MDAKIKSRKIILDEYKYQGATTKHQRICFNTGRLLYLLITGNYTPTQRAEVKPRSEDLLPSQPSAIHFSFALSLHRTRRERSVYYNYLRHDIIIKTGKFIVQYQLRGPDNGGVCMSSIIAVARCAITEQSSRTCNTTENYMYDITERTSLSKTLCKMIVTPILRTCHVTPRRQLLRGMSSPGRHLLREECTYRAAEAHCEVDGMCAV